MLTESTTTGFHDFSEFSIVNSSKKLMCMKLKVCST